MTGKNNVGGYISIMLLHVSLFGVACNNSFMQSLIAISGIIPKISATIMFISEWTSRQFTISIINGGATNMDDQVHL